MVAGNKVRDSHNGDDFHDVGYTVITVSYLWKCTSTRTPKNGCEWNQQKALEDLSQTSRRPSAKDFSQWRCSPQIEPHQIHLFTCVSWPLQNWSIPGSNLDFCGCLDEWGGSVRALIFLDNFLASKSVSFDAGVIRAFPRAGIFQFAAWSHRFSRNAHFTVKLTGA